MCRFVESIKLNNGVFSRLKFHQRRVNNAFREFFPNEEPVNIFENLNQTLIPGDGIYKCRVVYDTNVLSIEFTPYVRREIKSLKLVETSIESTVCKFDDRTEYNEMYILKGNCDDVLLIKNGLLTDSSYSNIALFDGENWITPTTPLIYGTNRAYLLENKVLMERDIKLFELRNFKKICLFNAMIEFGEVALDIDKIY